MKAKSLAQLLNKPELSHEQNIVGITADSRNVSAGYLFVAMKGDATDGHQYIRSAVELGAVAVLVEDKSYAMQAMGVPVIHVPGIRQDLGVIASVFFDLPTQALQIIGVTGTNGKTSITHYFKQLLQLMDKSCGVVGTLGVSYANKHYSTANTTPDAVMLQQYFAQMKESDVQFAAMEVSSHALQQYRCAGVKFDTAIMSNVTHDHLDYHGTMQNYLNAKLKLFQAPGLRVAIVNADDASYATIKTVLEKNVKCRSYSIDGNTADYQLKNIMSHSAGYQAKLHVEGREYDFSIGLLGDFNLSNVLAAVIAVVEQGISVEKVVALLPQLMPVPGRMELVKNNKNIVAVVDYAHTPDALENVLRSLRKQVDGRIFVVFGCGGDRDKTKRPLMGKVASEFADFVVVTSDNPRTEVAQHILLDIEKGVVNKSCVLIEDRKLAIQYAVNQAKDKDCVLVAGKGHEKMQIIGGQQLPFDDVEELGFALLAKVSVQ
jgi:UDP-N-acetylmuramoyl-L-alanyl-D-glutamate--2,6-diaminopimelate ligase